MARLGLRALATGMTVPIVCPHPSTLAALGWRNRHPVGAAVVRAVAEPTTRASMTSPAEAEAGRRRWGVYFRIRNDWNSHGRRHTECQRWQWR